MPFSGDLEGGKSWIFRIPYNRPRWWAWHLRSGSAITWPWLTTLANSPALVITAARIATGRCISMMQPTGCPHAVAAALNKTRSTPAA